MSASPKLACEGLRKTYGDRLVVNVSHLEIARGETLAILGPNGAGKSTLFRQLALLESPDEGRVLLNGRPVTPKDLDARRRMASVFQRALLFQGTVADNVAYGLRLRRTSRGRIPQLVDHALDLVGLSDFRESPIKGLSGGELQRVALARALVLEPEILFLDEPTSSLDPTVRQSFRSDLRELIGRVDATVVLITHDQSEAMLLCDRVAVLREGRIAQVGAPREVFTRPSSAFVAEFMGVETLWNGHAEEASWGLLQVRTSGGLSLEAVGEGAAVGDRVTVALRAEDIHVSVAVDDTPDRPVSSARNRWRGTISRMEHLGPVVRLYLDVRCDGGVERLAALVTRRSAEELDLDCGLKVVASVKATAVHVIPVPSETAGSAETAHPTAPTESDSVVEKAGGSRS